MKTVCLCISKEVEDYVGYDNLKNYFPSINNAIRDEHWIIDDIQII